MKLYVFMEIDTCPICGREIWVQENGIVGEQNVDKIPPDTVFVIRCTDETGTNIMCGEFQIKRVNPETLDDDWTATYIPTPGIHG